MIPHVEFGKLRLARFLPNETLTELNNWEVMGKTWVGEALSFSEWLRPVNTPETLGSLAIDFDDFPHEAATKVLQVIDLPVRVGMSAQDLTAILGAPVRTHTFTAGRDTYDFAVSGESEYLVSCTVSADVGLTYLVVLTSNPST